MNPHGNRVVPNTGDATFRPYRDEDREEVFALFERCFRSRLAGAHWDWKYGGNPCGLARILVAEQAGRIIAHYAAYPVGIRDGAKEAGIALQIGDVMTDPAVRGTGFGSRSVIARLAKSFYATYCEGQVLFNFGVPSFKHLRLGRLVLAYHTIGPVQEWRLPTAAAVATEDRIRPRRPLGRRTRLHLRREAPDWAAAAALFQHVQPQLGICVDRSPAYLAWRFQLRPQADYRFYQVLQDDRLVLWAVAAERDREIALGDVMFEPASRNCFHVLLAGLRRDAPAKELVLWSPSQPAWWQAALLAAGFRPRPQAWNVRTGFTFFDHARYGALRMNREWFYAMADFDLF